MQIVSTDAQLKGPECIRKFLLSNVMLQSQLVCTALQDVGPPEVESSLSTSWGLQ